MGKNCAECENLGRLEVCRRCDLDYTLWSPREGVAAEGTKHDQAKAPMHLIAPEINDALASILAFGATKYGDRNWEKGMAWHRPFSACLRHLWAWWRGGVDEETGQSHLWHAACCIMFLVAYEARGVGTDDRPKRSA